MSESENKSGGLKALVKSLKDLLSCFGKAQKSAEGATKLAEADHAAEEPLPETVRDIHPFTHAYACN
jgi:hypothetical protein